MSDDIRKQYDAIDADLRPHWESLVHAAHAKGLLCSGFIWGDPVPASEDIYMVRFGNVFASSPQEMFAIHYQLAVMAAKMELAGKMQRTETPVDATESAPSTQTIKPLELADKLALILLIAPSDAVPAEVLEVLNQYLAARRPSQIPQNGKV
jgi:hypothetical protein